MLDYLLAILIFHHHHQPQLLHIHHFIHLPRFSAPTTSHLLLGCSLQSCECNQVNRQTYVQALVEHSLGAIVKYPEMGASKDLSVAHIFDVNPDPDHFINPKFNFQYSLGDGHGGQNNALCDLLKGAAGNPVLCEKLRTSCKYNRGLFFFVSNIVTYRQGPQALFIAYLPQYLATPLCQPTRAHTYKFFADSHFRGHC